MTHAKGRNITNLRHHGSPTKGGVDFVVGVQKNSSVTLLAGEVTSSITASTEHSSSVSVH